MVQYYPGPIISYQVGKWFVTAVRPLLPERIDEAAWTKFPNLKRWVDEVGARPAVQKGGKVHKEWGARKLTPDEQKARQALLFNQTNDKVRAAREQAAKGVR